MKITKSLTALAVAGVMLTMTTGCGAKSPNEGQNPPSATQSAQGGSLESPTDTPTAVKPVVGGPLDNEFSVDTSGIIPADVTAAYGTDNLSTLLKDSLTSASVAYNQIDELHQARSQTTAIVYEPMRSQMTGTAFEILVNDALSSDSVLSNHADSLVPSVSIDGTIVTVNGTKFAADPTKSLSWGMTNTPRVILNKGALATDQRIFVEMTLAMNAPVIGGKTVTITRVLRLVMLQDSESKRWLIDGWSTSVLVPVAIVSSTS